MQSRQRGLKHSSLAALRWTMYQLAVMFSAPPKPSPGHSELRLDFAQTAWLEAGIGQRSGVLPVVEHAEKPSEN